MFIVCVILFLFHELQNIIVEITKQQWADIFVIGLMITENYSILTYLQMHQSEKKIRNGIRNQTFCVKKSKNYNLFKVIQLTVRCAPLLFFEDTFAGIEFELCCDFLVFFIVIGTNKLLESLFAISSAFALF